MQIYSAKFGQKKMHDLDEEKIECALGNKEFCFWQGKKAENAVFLFLMSGLAAFIFLWLLENSSYYINHAL